ncbi:MAG: histidinol-phosphate transaminase [Phycisphaeraceae bacterium]|nr:histidinol-phosphate transaminase [Phycisphaeraceae bacterium]
MTYFRDNIEQMAGYTPGFQPQTVDVVKLNTNENPYPPSPRVLEALQALPPEALRRYPDPIGQAFREAAANLHGLTPDSILCCNGGDDLLTLVFRAFCDETRPVAYPVPTYTLYAVLARIQNCATAEVPFGEQFTLPDTLAEVGAPLTIVCNPNAPTGTLIEPDRLADLAKQIKGVLLIDEAYGDFADTHCLDLVHKLDNVIILRSMSKGYSLAGIRFGYAIANPTLIRGLMKVKDSYNVDAMTLAAATAAIQDQAHFQINVEKTKAARTILMQDLQGLGLACQDSHTNFVLVQSPDFPADTLQEQLAARHIFVRYFSVPGLADKLRITVGTPEQNTKLTQVLKQILGK